VELFVFQLLNGLVYGMLLFLLSAGLSLIFGLMNIVNLAHGSFYMLGAFFGLTVLRATGNFWVALVIAPVLAAALGAIVEMIFLRPIYQRGPLDQVLLTFGFTLIVYDLVKWIWGGDIRQLPAPGSLIGTLPIVGTLFPKYRLFLISLGLVLSLLLWLFLDRSRLGAMVRAGVDNSKMAAGIGINVGRLFTNVFALGVGLAALGGVAAGPVMGLYPGMDAEILIVGFIVVVCGGMGSLLGAFISSILIGEADTFGKAYFPEAAMFMIYAVMIVVLLIRPTGLFGIKRSSSA
jgi:branched-subunit amino acid ABC-type transport system permease component